MTRPPRRPSFFEKSPSGEDWLSEHDRYEVALTEWMKEDRLKREASDAVVEATAKAELAKPTRERSYFSIGEIAHHLARPAGSMLPDPEECTAIHEWLRNQAMRGELVDDAGGPGGFTLNGEHPFFHPLLPKSPNADGAISGDAHPKAIYISGAALHRFLSSSRLSGASRLSEEWFGGRTASDVLNTQRAYIERVAEFQKSGRPPPLETTKAGVLGDRQWATANGISREILQALRKEFLATPPRRGRPPNSAGK